MSYTTLQSTCFPLTGFAPVIAIFPTDYTDVAKLPAPAPLRIIIGQVTDTSISKRYNFTFGDNLFGSFVTYAVVDSNPTFSFLDVPSYTSMSGKAVSYNGVVGIDVLVEFIANTPKAPGLYNIGDKYTIHIDIPCQANQPGIQVTFQRPNNAILNTLQATGTVQASAQALSSNNRLLRVNALLNSARSNCSSCTGPTGSNIIPNLVRIPIINILGQTTVDGEFLSDFSFNVQDKYQYYDNHAKINCECDDCEPIYANPDCLKTTKFFQYGPQLQCVVKGKGKTLRDKLLYTYNRNSTAIGPSFQDFYIGMIVYGMLKYILARVLYGDFNLKYLSHNFNCQFFKDLAHSRFCGFIEFFEDPANGIVGYNRYFKNYEAC